MCIVVRDTNYTIYHLHGGWVVIGGCVTLQNQRMRTTKVDVSLKKLQTLSSPSIKENGIFSYSFLIAKEKLIVLR